MPVNIFGHLAKHFFAHILAVIRYQIGKLLIFLIGAVSVESFFDAKFTNVGPAYDTFFCNSALLFALSRFTEAPSGAVPIIGSIHIFVSFGVFGKGFSEVFMSA